MRGAVGEGVVPARGQRRERLVVAAFEGVRIEGGGAVEREDGVGPRVDDDGRSALPRQSAVGGAEQGGIEGRLDVLRGNVVSFEQREGRFPPDDLEARTPLPRKDVVHGRFEADRPHAIAGLEDEVGAGGDLRGRVLTGVAHDVGGGGAKGVNAALFEPEDRPRHGLDEAGRLLHARIGHDAEGHALAPPQGAREGRPHRVFAESEGDEGGDGLVFVEDAAPVEAEDARVEGDRQGFAMAVVDRPARPLTELPAQPPPGPQFGMEEGRRPGDSGGILLKRNEGDGSGILQHTEVACFETNAKGQPPAAFVGDGDGDGDGRDGGFRAEGGVGAGEFGGGELRLRAAVQQGVHGLGVPGFPGGGEATGDGRRGLARGSGGGGLRRGSGRAAVPLDEDANAARCGAGEDAQKDRRQKEPA